jgi:excisionase family DNA binding protein
MSNVSDAIPRVNDSPTTWERIRTIAERTGVTDETVRTWCKTGAIDARKVGGTWLVRGGQFDG